MLNLKRLIRTKFIFVCLLVLVKSDLLSDSGIHYRENQSTEFEYTLKDNELIVLGNSITFDSRTVKDKTTAALEDAKAKANKITTSLNLEIVRVKNVNLYSDNHWHRYAFSLSHTDFLNPQLNYVATANYYEFVRICYEVVSKTTDSPSLVVDKNLRSLTKYEVYINYNAASFR